MILDELVLRNVGVFGGRHQITLTPPDARRPVVVIGALNGGGKTTVLESLHLALFGSLARTASRRSASYQTYLRRLIHNGVPGSEGAGVELAFHVYQGGSRRNYRVVRTWTATDSNVRERLDVLVDGMPDRSLTDRWAEQVEAFVPRGVAELFFFDGEKIETLAELDNAREMLKTAIGALLGLDLVDRLSTDLSVIERNYRADLAPPATHKLLEAANRRAKEAHKAAAAAKQDAAQCRTVAERAENKLRQLEEQLRMEGSELLVRERTLEDEKARLEKALKTTDTRLHDLASSIAPLRLVRTHLIDVLSMAEQELAADEQSQVAGVLVERDAEILDWLRSHRVKKQTIDELELLLSDERQTRIAGAGIERVVQLGAEETSRLRSLIDHDLDLVGEQIAAALTERDHLVRQLDEIIHTLAAVPDRRALDALYARRDAALADWTVARSAAAQADGSVADAEAHAVKQQRIVERLLQKATEEVAENDDARRIIHHSERVRDTLATLRVEATRRNLQRIESLVIQALQRLLRKERLVSDLKIDPETFAIELRGDAGNVVLPQQLSAGERQLLAVSLLWGLAQASGRPLPVVIDTPLGRLDGIHRSHLVSRYFPQASHQVILLSTDQEIDQAAWDRLHPHVGHAYRLEYNSKTGHTTAEPGYFWPKPVAS
ncbi:DNA sulfur modification protein DndD [Nocardia cyriacigeorgica]|uniref:Nuclease SbcCD subunit C n=1 Tax=Nocardia cyriacigeorgica TaxID=135487 RepID=A0A5R8PAX0_9NOCA|nr:DNA sulfur modification protein DndD [Nocardia cyriacigeorgica]TLG01815.1 DNA sulfur modification protein DndD [Nocardia cyriacigeorgica]